MHSKRHCETSTNNLEFRKHQQKIALIPYLKITIIEISKMVIFNQLEAHLNRGLNFITENFEKHANQKRFRDCDESLISAKKLKCNSLSTQNDEKSPDFDVMDEITDHLFDIGPLNTANSGFISVCDFPSIVASCLPKEYAQPLTGNEMVEKCLDAYASMPALVLPIKELPTEDDKFESKASQQRQDLILRCLDAYKCIPTLLAPLKDLPIDSTPATEAQQSNESRPSDSDQIPFEMLKEVLERVTPEQLSYFEKHNSYIGSDSDNIWKGHCQRRFKTCERQEAETWREMYYRCQKEHETCLKELTNKMKKAQSAEPRQQKSRSVIKKQNDFKSYQHLTESPITIEDTDKLAKCEETRRKMIAAFQDKLKAKTASKGISKKKAPLMAKTQRQMKQKVK